MTHEALVSLFRDCPALALRLFENQLHLAQHDKVRIEAAELSELDPAEYRADVVLVLTDHRDQPVEALVVEVQLQADANKRYSWPLYVAGLRARHRCPVTLAVIAIDARVATWCGAIIDLGHERCTLRPLVIGPADVPVIHDIETARQTPELAVLSVAAHGHEPEAERIAVAALAAVSEHEHSALYADLVYFFLSRVARQALETIMGAFKYEYQSDFAKKYVAEGKAEGLAEGEAKGLAESLLILLDEGKGFEVPDDLRAHIKDCQDSAMLRGWYRRALGAQALGDIFEAELLEPHSD